MNYKKNKYIPFPSISFRKVIFINIFFNGGKASQSLVTITDAIPLIKLQRRRAIIKFSPFTMQTTITFNNTFND